MLTNPYNPLGIQWEENHVVQGRVSQDDFYFLKQKFPYYPGLFDKLISNLYKAVIDELRRRDRETHIETALYIDDPSYRVLDEIIADLSCLERRPVGDDSFGRDPTPQLESGRPDSIHPALQRPAVERPDEESSPPSRKRRAKSTKKEKK